MHVSKKYVHFQYVGFTPLMFKAWLHADSRWYISTPIPLVTSLCSIPGMIKLYGSHLKASAAMVRLRLYDVLALLPAESFESESQIRHSVKIHQIHQLCHIVYT